MQFFSKRAAVTPEFLNQKCFSTTNCIYPVPYVWAGKGGGRSNPEPTPLNNSKPIPKIK